MPLPAGYTLDQSQSGPKAPAGYTIDQPQQSAPASQIDPAQRAAGYNPLVIPDSDQSPLANFARFLQNRVNSLEQAFERFKNPGLDEKIGAASDVVRNVGAAAAPLALPAAVAAPFRTAAALAGGTAAGVIGEQGAKALGVPQGTSEAIGTAAGLAGGIAGERVSGLASDVAKTIASDKTVQAAAKRAFPKVGKALDLASKIRNAVSAYRAAEPEASPATPPAPPAVQPRALLPAGPMVTPPPADTSFVRSVPAAQTPEGVYTSAAAETPRPAIVPPAPAEDPVLLDAIASAQTGKKFSKLGSADQQTIRELAAKLQTPQPAPQPPIAPQAQPQTPAPEPTAPGETIFDIAKRELQPAAEPAAPVTPPAPAKPSLAQVEARMAQKAPPPMESPQSPYFAEGGDPATGGRKSPQYRAMEIENANRLAKAQRFAQFLHNEGVKPEDLGNIPAGHFTQAQVDAGGSYGWGNIAELMGEKAPSADTVRMIHQELQKLGKAAPKAEAPAPVKPAATAPKNAKAAEIAKQLRDEMLRSGTIKE